MLQYKSQIINKVKKVRIGTSSCRVFTCGLLRNCSLKFKQPPVRCPSQFPWNSAACQLFSSEKTLVFIWRQMVSALKFCMKSSKGIQNSPSSSNTRPIRVRDLRSIASHSADLKRKCSFGKDTVTRDTLAIRTSTRGSLAI